MDKFRLGLIILLLLAPISYAQEQQDEITREQGIQGLYTYIEKNTNSQNTATKRIEQLFTKIEEQNTRFIGYIIMGNSAFLLMLYLTTILFDTIRVRRKKKKHEEYIKELEEIIKNERLGMIETFDFLIKRNTEAMQKLEQVEKRAKYINQLILEHEKCRISHTAYYNILFSGIGIGVTIVLLGVYLIG